MIAEAWSRVLRQCNISKPRQAGMSICNVSPSSRYFGPRWTKEHCQGSLFGASMSNSHDTIIGFEHLEMSCMLGHTQSPV